MNRMAKSDACKDSLTHMSYDFAESQRSLTGFAGIIKQNSRGGHALPGKMSVRTGPSEGPLLQRRTDKTWEVTAFSSASQGNSRRRVIGECG